MAASASGHEIGVGVGIGCRLDPHSDSDSDPDKNKSPRRAILIVGHPPQADAYGSDTRTAGQATCPTVSAAHGVQRYTIERTSGCERL
jgi:hypothetical protein